MKGCLNFREKRDGLMGMKRKSNVHFTTYKSGKHILLLLRAFVWLYRHFAAELRWRCACASGYLEKKIQKRVCACVCRQSASKRTKYAQTTKDGLKLRVTFLKLVPKLHSRVNITGVSAPYLPQKKRGTRTRLRVHGDGWVQLNCLTRLQLVQWHQGTNEAGW